MRQKLLLQRTRTQGPVGCFNPPFYLILLNLEESRCWIRKEIRLVGYLGFGHAVQHVES